MIDFDRTVLSCFNQIEVSDPKEIGETSRMTERLPRHLQFYRYTLRDRRLMDRQFDQPITQIALRQVGDMTLIYAADRFATEVEIGLAGLDRFCFTFMLNGQMDMTQDGKHIVAAGTQGLAFRLEPGTNVLTDDRNARLNYWLDGPKMERALESRIDDQLNRKLVFDLGVDWSKGLAHSFQNQLGYLLNEMRRPDGLLSNAVALASFNDAVTQILLSGLTHNFSHRLVAPPHRAAPVYLRRAEAFMRANAAKPLRLEEVAAASGCSVRTLSSVFRQFRGTTPLAALHRIRLDEVRFMLQRHPLEAPAAELARQFGFSNAGRFTKAYRRQFGELPKETLRRSR